MGKFHEAYPPFSYVIIREGEINVNAVEKIERKKKKVCNRSAFDSAGEG
jgi:hypothetical protein